MPPKEDAIVDAKIKSAYQSEDQRGRPRGWKLEHHLPRARALIALAVKGVILNERESEILEGLDLTGYVPPAPTPAPVQTSAPTPASASASASTSAQTSAPAGTKVPCPTCGAGTIVNDLGLCMFCDAKVGVREQTKAEAKAHMEASNGEGILWDAAEAKKLGLKLLAGSEFMLDGGDGRFRLIALAHNLKGWGALSVDDSVRTRMYVTDSTVDAIGAGYCTYAIGDSHNTFSHSSCNAADYGAITGGEAAFSALDRHAHILAKIAKYQRKGAGKSGPPFCVGFAAEVGGFKRDGPTAREDI